MIPASQLFTISSFSSIALAAWMLAGHELLSRPDLDIPLNVLGINHSPYGEVIALAMQGPIDQTFQGGYLGSVGKRTSPSKDWTHTTGMNHSFSVNGLLSRLDTVSRSNTNPRLVSRDHRFYLRRNAEDKLRFAYQLDPSQYSNYNSLHFFLTEPAVGTRGTLTPAASALAWETISYCLKQKHDPRPALTAAAACTNLLHLMFMDRQLGNRNYSTDQMREVLAVLDQAIARYDEIADQWDASQNWDLLSPQRIQECLDRYDFILKIRNAGEITISRFSTSQNQTDQSK